MKKLATVAVAVVMTAVSGFSVAGDLIDGAAVQIKVSKELRVVHTKHEGFKWGEMKSQRRLDTKNDEISSDRTSQGNIVLAQSMESAPSRYETNGFRWGIRNHHKTQGFRWGIR